MTVEIDTNLLLEYHLNANQFMLAYLVYKEDLSTLSELIKNIDKETLLSDLRVLEECRFIHNLNSDDGIIDLSNIIIRNNFIVLFKQDIDIFEEFLDLYPVKVKRPDGFYDYLRTDTKRCKRKYNQIVAGKMAKHNRLIKALKYELDIREKEGSIMYMKRLPKWLSSEEWKIFEERMKDDTNTESNQSYGTTIE